MIHIRTDHEELNSKRRFACGLGPALPAGDQYYFEAESAADRHADCPACRSAVGLPESRPEIGTKLSEMTPQRFAEIARSWGYD